MRKLILAAATAALSLSMATSAFALNPQPEPPGKNIVLHVPAGSLRMIGSATGGAGSGRASDADDNYCGTRVPGIPHVGGGFGGGRFSDADDNYCGTKVPGHFGGPVTGTFNAARLNSHEEVMLNPQPLPPHEGDSFRRPINSHEAVMLNPQPLPPVDGGGIAQFRR